VCRFGWARGLVFLALTWTSCCRRQAIRKYELPREGLVIMTKLFNPVPPNGEKYADRAEFESAGCVSSLRDRR
jgi:hypothetical protein